MLLTRGVDAGEDLAVALALVAQREEELLLVGGKTGTGDNRLKIYRGGHLLESRPVDRTATFVFFIGDRFYGTVTAHVAGREAAPSLVAQDEGPNVALTEQQLALYPPLFKEGGTVTAGNSCPLNDGAAAAVVMSAERARELGLAPLGRIRGYALVGVEPTRMGIGPAEALPLALKRSGLKLADLELLEANEAFAAQYLAVERLLGLKREIVNVNGGAIALGHPVGMTGTRLVITLLYEMRRRGATLGAVTLCVGGGQGAAMVFERV